MDYNAMDYNVAERLEYEISREIDNLERLEPGSTEHLSAVEGLAKLYKLRIDETSVRLNFESQENRRNTDMVLHNNDSKIDMDLRMKQIDGDIKCKNEELEIKNAQLRDSKIDRYINIALRSIELAVPFIFGSVWMAKGLKFEETGSLTSSVFRGLHSKFVPNIK